MTRLESALAAHQARLLTVLAETAMARVYAVETPRGPAVLKLYGKSHAGNEAAGAPLMQAWEGSGAMVAIWQASADTLLMERLEGPCLGDIARQGQDARACDLLADVAHRLHSQRPAPTADLPRLEAWFAALFDMRFAPACAPKLRADMARAQLLARGLLESTKQQAPLHGDLHHDNVILTVDRGPVAFDAKGVLGDPAYEMANALRNPKGVPEHVCDPTRFKRCVAIYAGAMGVEPARLAAWGAAKTGLSIAWRAKGTLSEDGDAPVLAMMLRAAGEAGWDMP